MHWHARSGFADQATLLAQRLGMFVRFAPIYSLDPLAAGAPRREFGVAVLSKFPITSFQNHALTRLSTVVAGAPPTPMPGFLEAVIDVRGSPVRVLDTHLDYRADPHVREVQVAEMLAIIGDAAAPTLLFGDMNATPDAKEIQPLFMRLHDAWIGQPTAGLSYPATDSKKRIDYVFASNHFAVRAARVPVTDASDHRPVVVDLVLPTGAVPSYR